MGLENGKVGNYQLNLLICGFVLGSSLIVSPGSQAKHDAWIAVSLGLIEGIAVAFIYILLNKFFPGKTLIEINDLVYGPYLGKGFSLAFIWFFFHHCSLVLAFFKDFFSVTIMPRTPDLIFSALIIAVSAYAVANGVEVVARCSQILVPIVLGVFLLETLFLLKDIDLRNLQPVLEIPWKDLLVASFKAASLPFTQIVVFMLIIPFVRNNQATPITTISGLILGGIVLIFASIRNIGVLGASAGIYTYHNFEATRLINVGNLVTRMEILTVLNFLSLIFIKITVLLYATVISGAQLLKLRTYRPLIIPVAILMIVFSLHNFKNANENLIFSQIIYPIYSFPFQIGIPLLTLIMAMIRGLPKKSWK